MKKNQPRTKKPKAKPAMSGAQPTGAPSAGKKLGSGASDDRAQAPIIEGRAEETGKKKKSANPFEFIQQVRSEASKISWTSRNETLISSIMVLIMVLVMVIFFFLVDQTLRFGICNILPISCVTTGG